MARLHVSAAEQWGAASAIVALCLLAALKAQATSLALYADPAGAMKPSELRQTFTGQELEGTYPDGGGEWSETYRPDGTLAYQDAATRSSGRWLVNGDRFCTNYDVAELQDACFQIRRRGDNCYDFYEVDGRYRPTVSLADIRTGVNFSARAWRRGEAATCPTSPEGGDTGGE